MTNREPPPQLSAASAIFGGNSPGKPYNALPLLPPNQEIETRAVLKQLVAARAALAELRLAGQLIPDQSVLINAIPILEARASSEIENIVTTNDALFREASLEDEHNDPAAKEALRYRTALYSGFEAMKTRPVTTRLAVELCRIIKAVELDVRATPGTALRNAQTGEVVYTPPQGEAHLRSLLANWETYVNTPSDIDPLVRLAVQHYQFEAIHPFTDGNGRTGRVLNLLFLVQERLLDQPTLYLSRHILRTRGDYYRHLDAITRSGEWEPWILYMLVAIEETARWTNDKIAALRRLMEETSGFVRKAAPKIYSRELVETIFTQPYCRITNLVERGIAKRQTAATYLQTLTELGVVVEERQWRDKLYVNRTYLDLLSAEHHTYPAVGGDLEGTLQRLERLRKKDGRKKG